MSGAASRAASTKGAGPANLAMLGFDYRTAPLDLRERLRLATRADVEEYLRQLLVPAVVLATCHRVEVYVDDPERLRHVADVLAARSGVSTRALEAHGIRRDGEECVRHLLEVAAGLRSAVVGEPQVLGQVKEALELARRVRAPGGVLGALFQRAIHAGKRVRTETMLGRSSPSLARAAVRWALDGGLDAGRARVLIVGSGEMAMLAAREAAAAGARQITFCARRPEHALQAAGAVLQRDAWRDGGGRDLAVEAFALDALPEELVRADLVISCTTAPGTVIPAAWLVEAMRPRGGPGRPLWVADLAVPRDVEVPDPLPHGLHVASIDEIVPDGASRPGVSGAEDVAAALAIVGQETAAFMEWLRQRRAAPVLVAMRQEAEAVRREQVEWALRRLDGEAGPRAREVLEAMSRRLTDKLMHLPTLYLKEMAAGERTEAAR